ncbi:MAG: hypothetical protein EOO43_11275, partial [Flavobacterium sp.]
MKGNYTQLTESIRQRNNPDNIIINKSFSDEISNISSNETLVFVRYAMKGVEPAYTKKSLEAGENAKKHLERKNLKANYRFQGSVMTDTHIKGYSDIDMLTIADQFYHWDSTEVDRYLTEQPLRNTLTVNEIEKLEKEKAIKPYEGKGMDDLKNLRLSAESVLSSVYVICNTSGAKSIKIRNQDLHRDVDVVFASWYDNVKSIINDKGD